MDKEWMWKDRLSREYEFGVESFLDFAKRNVTNSNQMPCPCVLCGNLRKNTVDRIRAHLICNGMDKSYHTWVLHGERSTNRSSLHDNDQGGDNRNYFPREPLDDMVHAAYENSKSPNKFVELLEDAEKPLYPGCTKFTKLSAIVKLYNLKAKYSWSQRSMADLLVLIKDMLPDNNELPSTTREAKNSLSTLGMEYKKIHACPNDCLLYLKEFKHHTICPTCGASRWKVGKNSKIIDKVPVKVLWYFPPIPRFRRMFQNKEVSQQLTWHADKRVCDEYMRHPVDSPSWKVVDHMWPDFALESRNFRLALFADGINPHSNMSSAYSCWPVILVTYNLPPWLCMKRKFMMLTLLIAGPKQPGNDIDVYLQTMIDDLKNLWEGIDAYDAYRDEKFRLRDVLLWTINDFPAYGNLSWSIVKGYKACPICGEKTKAKMLKHSRKMPYTAHRRFLHRNHPYRQQKKAFNGKQEKKFAPKPLNGCDVLTRVAGIQCNWGKRSRNLQPKEELGCWKKKFVFFELEYWQHLHVRHVLDVMHIEKNVCESLIGTLLDIPGKTKDGVAA